MYSDPRMAWLARYDRFAAGAVNAAVRIDNDDMLWTPALAAVLPVARQSILVSRPEIAAFGDIASVNASSLIVGPAAPVALASDHRVTGAVRSGGDVVAALRTSPLTGCTSIMDLALRQSGWNPLDPRQFGNRPAFSKYVELLAASHFFETPPRFSSNSLDLNRYPDPQAMAGGVAALLPEIGVSDRQRVTDSIIHMAHNVFGGTGRDTSASAQATLFVQHAVAVGESDIRVHLYWCQALMSYSRHTDKGTVTVSRQSTFAVDRFDFTFLMSSWPTLAQEIARRTITDVETWLKATSTP